MSDVMTEGEFEAHMAGLTRNVQSWLNGADDKKERVISDIEVARDHFARGTRFQDLAAKHRDIKNLLGMLTSDKIDEDKDMKDLTWQMFANMVVQNPTTQNFVWEKLGQEISYSLKTHPIDVTFDRKLLIIHNMMKGGSKMCSPDHALTLLTEVWYRSQREEHSMNIVYIDIFFEYFLMLRRDIATIYSQLPTKNRTIILEYFVAYTFENSPNGPMQISLMDQMVKDFKKRSSNILVPHSDNITTLNSWEAYHLIKAVSTMTGIKLYEEIWSGHKDLFTCAGKLLQEVIEDGQYVDSPFSPRSDIRDFDPGAHPLIEVEIGYEVKTNLVQMITNLLALQKENRMKCVDMNLIPTLLGCTVKDARNPLLKEWTIFAIRYACENCPEAQQVISELEHRGDVPQDFEEDLNAGMKEMQIQEPGIDENREKEGEPEQRE